MIFSIRAAKLVISSGTQETICCICFQNCFIGAKLAKNNKLFSEQIAIFASAMKKIIVCTLALLSAVAADTKVRLPQLFQEGMVLQREKPIAIWGEADAGEEVNVTFKKKVYRATATADGRWQLTIPAQKAGGPYQLQVNDQIISNCLIGDVWLCSGQSNIDVTIERVYPQYGKVIDDYKNDRIRLFRVQTDTDTHGPKKDIKPTSINWKPASKENAWLFSAVGYFLAREMFEKTGVPQGVIVNSLGGTPIQAWLSPDTLEHRWPAEWQRTCFYQNDDMVHAMMRANQLANGQWDRLLNDHDALLATGGQGPDEGWRSAGQYDNLTGRQQYRGSFWARQQIHIDAAHSGKSARLLVGTLFDADFTYINGRQVGHTGYQYPPRRYQIPAGLLHEGNNTLAVRFITKGGNPHFIKEKPYKLIFDDGTEVKLEEKWQVREGVQMPSCPQTDINIQNLPSVLYNAMLAPLAPYTLQGVVWYQGESNTGADATNYEKWLTQLVSGWRQLWNAPSLPFVIVQLANFMEPSAQPQNSPWSVVREAQRQVAAKTNLVELAVTIDLGEKVDIHPLRKREVAQRIVCGFDHMLWNKKLLLSPQVVSTTVQGKEVTLTLDQPLRGEGLLHEFEVAGGDNRFVTAKARGNGCQIVVTSAVEHPAAIRYAWKNNPEHADVYGRNGLPMSPFCVTID